MSFGDRDGYIWLDGEFIAWREAKVHVLTHSLHYALSVFEGIRVYETPAGPAVFRLADHTDRLYNSAKILNINIPYEQEKLIKAQQEIILRNKLNAAYIRPLVFYGDDNMGLNVTKNHRVRVAIAAWEWGAYLGAEGLEKGIKVKTSSYTRHHINSTMSKAKASGNYINSIMARQEAANDGYDEALMLDTNGCVAEGSGENIFIVRNKEIITPPLISCLNGITRDTVITLAKEAGFTVSERCITRDEVYIADEVFFTGTAAEVTPIVAIDNRQVGDGRKGPITNTLQQQYFDLVQGKTNSHQDWLSVVS